ncbi:hypothetical protein Nepgr_015598 [Nepenthes gracilis]|uniref:Uncharacterized protein n=1 Tax=Nepenthes gracilis TaxID=150966 RepID=A0AAD3SNJ4_NEPGR|nr:hypothetical protein Nepgr_015598 [Nepenthes gracilis]
MGKNSDLSAKSSDADDSSEYEVQSIRKDLQTLMDALDNVVLVKTFGDGAARIGTRWAADLKKPPRFPLFMPDPIGEQKPCRDRKDDQVRTRAPVSKELSPKVQFSALVVAKRSDNFEQDTMTIS